MNRTAEVRLLPIEKTEKEANSAVNRRNIDKYHINFIINREAHYWRSLFY